MVQPSSPGFHRSVQAIRSDLPHVVSRPVPLSKDSPRLMETFHKPSGNILQALRKHSTSLVETFYKPCRNIP